MNIFVWIVQIILAIIFFMHGLIFLNPPSRMKEMIEQGPLSKCMRWFIGSAEILGAIGLSLPGMLKLYTWVIPLSACGLAIVMAGAVIFHIGRKEIKETLITLILFALTVFIAYLRWTEFAL